jgi:hypothetical protein
MVQELLSQIKDKISYGIDPGISIEIRDYFRGREDIDAFNVGVIDGKSYIISVSPKNFSLNESNRIFLDLMHFIEYSAGSFFIRNKSGDLIKYSLLSFNKDLKGFYCEVEFAPATLTAGATPSP